MDEINDQLVARLKATMKLAKMSLKHMSEKIGLPYRSLQNYMSGKTRLPADVYVLMCQELGVDNQYVMQGNFHLERWPLYDAIWVSLDRHGYWPEYVVKADVEYDDSISDMLSGYLPKRKRPKKVMVERMVDDVLMTYHQERERLLKKA
ncbi:helix-turn-helix transcriptional regulator [Pseudovibrio sp. POLY-S9]|uniref:helix-turn-helix domain-containing protein n=1 Tax=Pseudovibrio sp. POLY-S9 TaxID=1576596 RepID=UPI00070CC657|nr:helix-turn-helix transcriptional regulator [Pseudovibrio sp. POLY-S9]